VSLLPLLPLAPMSSGSVFRGLPLADRLLLLPPSFLSGAGTSVDSHKSRSSCSCQSFDETLRYDPVNPLSSSDMLRHMDEGQEQQKIETQKSTLQGGTQCARALGVTGSLITQVGHRICRCPLKNLDRGPRSRSNCQCCDFDL
jgi:hypothetical protein